jgi:uncharacterized protein YlxW (UPF0749 family)
MAENEGLKLKIVELQREFEEKENELVAEINNLVARMNSAQPQEEDAEGEEELDTTQARMYPIVTLENAKLLSRILWQE